MATGINISTNLNLDLCQYCIYGGQHKQSSNHPASRATKLLKLIHTDICGPMNTISIGGAKFFILFIDDFSQMTTVYFLKTKGEAFDKFLEYKALVENQLNMKIK